MHTTGAKFHRQLSYVKTTVSAKGGSRSLSQSRTVHIAIILYRGAAGDSFWLIQAKIILFSCSYSCQLVHEFRLWLRSRPFQTEQDSIGLLSYFFLTTDFYSIYLKLGPSNEIDFIRSKFGCRLFSCSTKLRLLTFDCETRNFHKLPLLANSACSFTPYCTNLLGSDQSMQQKYCFWISDNCVLSPTIIEN